MPFTTSSAISSPELGLCIEGFDQSVFASQSSLGIRREAALSIMNMLGSIIKRQNTHEVYNSVLSDLEPEQQEALGHIIDNSGVADNAPTHREQTEAKIILDTLGKIE